MHEHQENIGRLTAQLDVQEQRLEERDELLRQGQIFAAARGYANVPSVAEFDSAGPSAGSAVDAFPHASPSQLVDAIQTVFCQKEAKADAQHRVAMAAYAQRAEQLHKHLDRLSPRSKSPRIIHTFPTAVLCALRPSASAPQKHIGSAAAQSCSRVASPRQLLTHQCAAFGQNVSLQRSVPRTVAWTAPSSPVTSQRPLISHECINIPREPVAHHPLVCAEQNLIGAASTRKPTPQCTGTQSTPCRLPFFREHTI